MGNSSAVPVEHDLREHFRDRVTIVESEAEVQTLLTALNDPDCRDILKATSEQPRSAKELSCDCDLPLSTTYRKLGMLTESGVLVERIRIRSSGKHASEFVRHVDDVTISVGTDGSVEVSISHQ